MTKKFRDSAALNRIQDMVGVCFLATEKTFPQLAQDSGLSLRTIYRLYNGEYSSAIRAGTLYSFAKAVGLELNIVSGRISLPKPSPTK